MQTVLDNMIGGVMLFDKDFRLQFLNRQVMEFQNYPSDVIKPGISGSTSCASRSSAATSAR